MFCESFVDVVRAVKDGGTEVVSVNDDVVGIIFEGMEC